MLDLSDQGRTTKRRAPTSADVLAMAEWMKQVDVMPLSVTEQARWWQQACALVDAWYASLDLTTQPAPPAGAGETGQ